MYRSNLELINVRSFSYYHDNFTSEKGLVLFDFSFWHKHDIISLELANDRKSGRSICIVYFQISILRFVVI